MVEFKVGDWVKVLHTDYGSIQINEVKQIKEVFIDHPIYKDGIILEDNLFKDKFFWFQEVKRLPGYKTELWKVLQGEI